MELLADRRLSLRQHHAAGVRRGSRRRALPRFALARFSGCRHARHLAAFVADQIVEVEWTKKDKYGRILRTVWAMLPARTDVNLQMVKDGFAWHYKHFDHTPSYAAAETAARTAKRGLWKEQGMRLEGVQLHVDRKSAAGTMEISQPSWIASSDCLQVTTIPDLSPNRLAAEARPPNSRSMLSSVSS